MRYNIKTYLSFCLICTATCLAQDQVYPNFPGACASIPLGGDISIAVDSFRSLPDGTWDGNFGAFASVNLAVGLPKPQYGLGLQVGGSYGLYDWTGRESDPWGNTKAWQQQAFLSAGLFRRTPHPSGVSAGLVYDLMFNKQCGVFGLDSQIAQVRGQVGYLLFGRNEIGAWGTYDTQTSHKESQQIPVTFRAISQANIFWTHLFKNTAETTLWVGTPYRKGLMHTSGRAGRYIIGANFRAPLSRSFSIVGHGVYMAPNSSSSSASQNYAANVSFGLNYSFGGCKAGERPYLNLADNSNFLIDTNLNM